MTLGALLLLLVGVGAMVAVMARTRALSRRTDPPADAAGPLPEVELPEDVAALVEAGEGDAAAHLLARRLGITVADARALLRVAE